MLRIVIVGGGFSGTALSCRLLRRLPPGSRVDLVERQRLVARGMAYGTCSPSHWLNVPAAGMSMDADDADGFVRWLHHRYPQFGPEDFVPRMLYAQYLADALDTARTAAQGRGVAWRQVHAEAVDLQRQDRGWRLGLADGTVLDADHVVLCTGHLPPRPLPLAGLRWGDEGLVDDPYAPGWLAALPTDAAVLLVGTGLTAIDALMALQDRGCSGPVWLLSRRGLLPQPHRWLRDLPQQPAPVWTPGRLTARGLLADLRRAVAQAARQGCNWRDVFAGLRAQTPVIWQQLPTGERRRLLRHLQPWWDTHRHRLAPGIHQRLTTLTERGSAHVIAGRIRSAERLADGRLAVHWQHRGGGPGHPLVVDAVVNCSGASADLRAASIPPLLAALRDRGHLVPDALGLGVAVDAQLRVIGADGRPVEGLSCLGPMLKSRWWEAVAVPELRAHADALAKTLATTAAAAT